MSVKPILTCESVATETGEERAEISKRHNFRTDPFVARAESLTDHSVYPLPTVPKGTRYR